MIRRCPLLLDGRALLDADLLIRSNLADRRASFELSFEALPPHAGFVVVSGLESFLDALYRLVIDDAQLEAAQRLCGFSDKLRTWLSKLTPTLDVDAMPDGTLAFAKTPIATVEGPFIEAVVIGALLRSIVQRATSVATRAARLHMAARGDAVIDGSSAHAASADGSLAVARWAFVGGASATTNVLASIMLAIPFRAATTIQVGVASPSAPPPSDGWGRSPADALTDLGTGDDEEALLLEAKRCGAKAGGWICRGLADVDVGLLPTRYELVALEQGGAWAPRRGVSGSVDVVPGRKRVVRYSDAVGSAVADIIHVTNERMQSPPSVGAVTLAPLARAAVRDGRMLEAPELPITGRERAIAARPALPAEVTYLRRPGTYRVELSEGLRALCDER